MQTFAIKLQTFEKMQPIKHSFRRNLNDVLGKSF